VLLNTKNEKHILFLINQKEIMEIMEHILTLVDFFDPNKKYIFLGFDFGFPNSRKSELRLQCFSFISSEVLAKINFEKFVTERYNKTVEVDRFFAFAKNRISRRRNPTKDKERLILVQENDSKNYSHFLYVEDDEKRVYVPIYLLKTGKCRFIRSEKCFSFNDLYGFVIEKDYFTSVMKGFVQHLLDMLISYSTSSEKSYRRTLAELIDPNIEERKYILAETLPKDIVNIVLSFVNCKDET
jgi:hypothetical protein